MNIIEASNLEYIYPDRTIGIKNFSLNIEESERVVLLGSNGCGKSTLLKLFAGLIKPMSGSIKIFEKDVIRENYLYFRKNIGFLFQNPDDFLFNPTVEDELLYTPMQLGFSEVEAKNLITENANYFGIEKLYEKPPFRLSGGEKKRVALACVLQLNPKLLILDEPTSNIDGKTRNKIIEFLKEYKGTMILSTHEIDFVKKISNKVVLLSPDKEILKVGGIELLEDLEYLEAAEIVLILEQSGFFYDPTLPENYLCNNVQFISMKSDSLVSDTLKKIKEVEKDLITLKNDYLAKQDPALKEKIEEKRRELDRLRAYYKDSVMPSCNESYESKRRRLSKWD